MSCFNKIKKALEMGKGVTVVQEGDYLVISKNNEVLTKYNLMFVEYSDDNMNGFIDHWKYRLNIKDKKETKKKTSKKTRKELVKKD